MSDVQSAEAYGGDMTGQDGARDEPEQRDVSGGVNDASGVSDATGAADTNGTSDASGALPGLTYTWQRVSPKYVWSDLVGNLLFALGAGALLVILALVPERPTPLPVLIIVGALALILLLNALLAFRRVRAIGYVLRRDDLLFRRGIMFERYVAVPYGRLQLVDVTRGPLMRALGLATLKFVTAGAATGVQLPGLPIEHAEVLRDRLVELAETRRSGL